MNNFSGFDAKSFVEKKTREFWREQNKIPVTTMAKNLAQSVGKFIGNGMKIVPNAVFFKRKEICLACDFYNKEAFGGTGRCMKCGCSTAKLKLPHEKCPIGKWGAELTQL